MGDIILPDYLLATLRYVAEGKTNEEIAVLCGISLQGARKRVLRLRHILGARNRTEVVQRGYQTGLLT